MKNEQTNGGSNLATVEHLDKRIHKKRTGRKILVTLLLIIALVLVVLFSPLFNLKIIYVEGNSRLTAEQIIDACGAVPGKNTFLFNTRSIRKNVCKLSYVNSATVSRVFPSDIKIIVEESYPAAVVPFVGSYIYIDQNSKILEVSPVLEEGQLPSVTGINPTQFHVGEVMVTDDENKHAVLKDLLQAIDKSDLSGRITSIDISDIYYMKMTVQNQEVIVGDNTELTYKLQLLTEILGKLREDERGTIDLTTAPNVVYREHYE